MMENQELFISNHFTIEQLDDGIFAALHREGGWAVANAGIIDLGDSSLVFDTFITVQAANDLKKAAERLTGKPVRFVVNSHYHNDHIWGNQVFDSQAQIISSDDTLLLIKTEGKEEYDSYKEGSRPRLRELQSEFLETNNESRRNELSTWIRYYQGLVETFPILNVRYPNLTFNKHMNIYGADLEIELIAYKGCHTGCDTILYIPSKQIIFMSDLLFVRCHPFLADGDPDKLLSTLDEIDRFQPKKLVPGHGPVGGIEDLRLMKEYIHHCDQTGKQIFEKDRDEADINETMIPEQYSKWILSNFYSTNLRFFYDRHRAKNQITI
jgi:glyoxylase-like metal-dependent hydrolase (beta-lactamase superfamily II)